MTDKKNKPAEQNVQNLYPTSRLVLSPLSLKVYNLLSWASILMSLIWWHMCSSFFSPNEQNFKSSLK